MGPNKMVLLERPGRYAGYVLLDHLVATRQGEGLSKIGAKGVASVTPGGRLFPTGSLPAGKPPGNKE